MAYTQYGDSYTPGEYYRQLFGKNRFRFTPNTETAMDSESFQRFLNLQRNPSTLFDESVKLPKGFTDYMALASEFGLNQANLR
jgi:hypothetical protein